MRSLLHTRMRSLLHARMGHLPRLCSKTSAPLRRHATTAPAERAVPVHARYLAKTIDVALFQEKFVQKGIRRRTFERDSVMLTINTSEDRRGHVVVFNYGAVVFFNVPRGLRTWCLQSFAPFCKDTIPDGFQPVEDYSCKVIDGGPTIGFDSVALPKLDGHNLAVIATVLAQSVALDHYAAKADAMLEAFTRLNSSVERTGVFSALEKRSLFRLVALNNTLFTDVIAKIGILERSNTAWKYLQYADIWEGLQDEFEIRDRFWKIEFKLNLIQQNSKFFLEVLATDKSNTLEWIIILLISIEILVMGVEIAHAV